ncbi:MAG: aspartate-semialdehyde dehydrogenase [Deltaproteobacteria bacterium]|nr:aspartate-semialdehyde dehydrogenase [Deltaproteobacteria bacterium]
MTMERKYKVAVVGATGAVGTELLRLLEERNFPLKELRLFASDRSKGKQLSFKGRDLPVESLEGARFEGVEIALFSAGAARSLEFAPKATAAGAIVIDNSSAYRNDPDVPLVVPEINSDAIQGYLKKGIIANPNCTTAVMLMGLYPLHRKARVRRMIVTSFQAASGAGAAAMEELRQQSERVLRGEEAEPKIFPHPIAFNLIPHIDQFLETGYTQEEMKLLWETRKILGDPEIEVNATTVRVPVFRAHSVSVHAEFEKKITVAEARALLLKAPGVRLWDDPSKKEYPMPILASDREECYVGRIRQDLFNPKALNLWVVGDQLLKGAALNAVQIAEKLIEGYLQ